MKIVMEGLDISTWQGKNVNWDALAAAGTGFAMLRAGFGTTPDNTFERNAAEANRVGIPIGAYLYSYARTEESAEREAEFLLETVKPFRLEMPAAVDIEDPLLETLGKERLTAAVAAFCRAVERRGYYAMFYTNLNWVKNKLDYEALKHYDFWLAQWNAEPTSPYPFGLWQHTCTGAAPGVSGDVCRDRAYKDYPEIIKSHGLNNLERPGAAAISWQELGDRLKSEGISEIIL